MKKYLCALLLSTLTLPASALWEHDPHFGEEGRLKTQERDIFSLALSPQGYLASGSFNGTTRVWDLKTQSVKFEFPGHANWVGAVAFDPQGQILASGGLDAQIQLWELQGGQNIKTLSPFRKGILSLAFSPDGKTLASGSLDNEIVLFDTQTWQVRARLRGHAGGVAGLAFSPDGKTLASCSFNDVGVRLWDVAEGRLLSTLSDHSEELYQVSFSPNGRYLASAGADRIIRIWDTQTWLPLARLAGHLKPVWSLAFSPNSQQLASGSIGDQSIRFWSVPQGVNEQTLSKVGEKTYALLFSPDGKQLFSGHNNASLRIWRDQAEDPKLSPGKALQIALSLKGWKPNGNNRELTLGLHNFGSEHLQGINAELHLKTPGVSLELPVKQFYLAQFEAGSYKSLVLPLRFKPGSLEAIELEIILKTAQGQLILPVRAPINTGD